MASHKNLSKRQGSANWYYREAVPIEVKAIFRRSGQPSKDEVWISLRTADLREAVRCLIATQAAQHKKWEQLCSSSNAAIMGKTPTDDDFLSLVDEVFENNLLIRSAKLGEVDSIDEAAWASMIDVESEKLRQNSKAMLKGELPTWAMRLADMAITRNGWSLPKHGSDGLLTARYRHFVSMLIEGLSDSQRTLLRRIDAEPFAQPQSAVVIEAKRRKQVKAAPGEALLQLYERYSSQAGKKADTIVQERKIIEMLSKFLGEERSLTSIQKPDIREFRNILLELPIKFNSRRGFDGLNLREMVERGKEAGFQRRDPRTIAKELSAVSSFFQWAVRDGFAEDNPVFGLAPKFNKSRNKYPNYEPAQLTAILSSPLFVGCAFEKGKEHQPGSNRVRDWRFWIPMCGLFTGARIGELAQLQVNDIKKEDNIWIFDLIADEEDGDKIIDIRSLKTESSRRKVPISAKIIELGFLDYVKDINNSGKVNLFPELYANSRGHYGAIPSRFWRTYLERIGVKIKGLGSHSFRHTITDELRRNGVMDAVISTLVGHKTGTITAHYGRLLQGSLKQRAEAIALVRYQDVDMSHLWIGAHVES